MYYLSLFGPDFSPVPRSCRAAVKPPLAPQGTCQPLIFFFFPRIEKEKLVRLCETNQINLDTVSQTPRYALRLT